MGCCDLDMPPQPSKAGRAFMHCTSCCRTFAGIEAFDLHQLREPGRIKTTCREPESLGMRYFNSRKFGTVWRKHDAAETTEPDEPIARVQAAQLAVTGDSMSHADAQRLLEAVPDLARWTVLDLTTALKGSTRQEMADPMWWAKVMKGAPYVQADAARHVGGRGKLPAVVVERFNRAHLDSLRPPRELSDEEIDMRLRTRRNDHRRLTSDPLSKGLVPRQRAADPNCAGLVPKPPSGRA